MFNSNMGNMGNLNNYVNNMVSQLMNDQEVLSNPTKMEMLNVIRTGDAKRGEEIAMNICNSYGMTPQEFIFNSLSGL